MRYGWQASTPAGYFKRAFVEILGKHKIPISDYSAEELEKRLGECLRLLYDEVDITIKYC